MQIRHILPEEIEQARFLQTATGDSDRMTRVLRAGRSGVSAFCEKLGFSDSAVAMERPGVRHQPLGAG